MKTIPITAVPNQNFSVTVEGQNCSINLYYRRDNLYFDLTVGTTAIVKGVICRNLVPLVCIQYTGFEGNFMFFDKQEAEDPDPDYLGTRFVLLYLTADEYAEF